jgi:hypothetical protein
MSTGSASIIVVVLQSPRPFLNTAQSWEIAIRTGTTQWINGRVSSHELVCQFTQVNAGLVAEHRPIEF